jgi:hypothetical protein
MKILLKITSQLTILLVSVTFANAQKSEIKITKASRLNNLYHVTYNFINPDNNIYTVYGEIIDSNYKITPIKYAIGDFGETVSDSSKKELFVSLDSSQIQNPVMLVKLYCKKYRLLGGPQNALLSIVVPGTGDIFVHKSKIPASLVMATYAAFLYKGFSNQSKYKRFYNDYKELQIQSEIDDAYSNASKYADKSRTSFSIAAAVLITDVTLVFVKGLMNKRKNNQLKSKLKIDKSDLKSAYIFPLIKENYSSVCFIYNF